MLNDLENKENQQKLIEDLKKFKRYKKDEEPSKVINEAKNKDLHINLWDYLNEIMCIMQCSATPVVFKSKDPKKYIQVKTQFFNGDTQFIVVCSDITRL